MRIPLDDLPEKYKQQALRQIRDQSASASAKRKRDSCDEQVAEKEATGLDRPDGFSGPVRITFRDSRKRLIDADNGWTKFWTDSLVTCGVIPDDDTSVIPSRPSVTQTKSKEEKLVIIVEEI